MPGGGLRTSPFTLQSSSCVSLTTQPEEVNLFWDNNTEIRFGSSGVAT